MNQWITLTRSSVDVSIGVVTRENCQVDPGDSVCIAKFSCPMPIADSLRLTLMYIIIKLGEPACLSSHSNLIRKDDDPAPNEKIFLDYLKYHLGESVTFSLAIRMTRRSFRGSNLVAWQLRTGKSLWQT